jgi:hypothetical protein
MPSVGIRVGKQTHSRRNEVEQGESFTEGDLTESRSVQETHEVIEQYRERRKGANTINRTGITRTPLRSKTAADGATP